MLPMWQQILTDALVSDDDFSVEQALVAVTHVMQCKVMSELTLASMAIARRNLASVPAGTVQRAISQQKTSLFLRWFGEHIPTLETGHVAAKFVDASRLAVSRYFLDYELPTLEYHYVEGAADWEYPNSHADMASIRVLGFVFDARSNPILLSKARDHLAKIVPVDPFQ